MTETDAFKTSDKRLCGFLYLRTLRTGSRALSLVRGSLLDIILRLQEDKSFKIWEDVLEQLRVLPVAEKPELGICKSKQRAVCNSRLHACRFRQQSAYARV